MNDGVKGVGLCKSSYLHPSAVGSTVLVLVSRGSLELFPGGPAGCSVFVFGPLHEHASTVLLFFHLQAMTKDNNKSFRVIMPHLFIY